MAIVARWVGSSISTSKERGLVPIGRQRRYGAVELAGAGEQVNVNDVVEVGVGDGAIKMEIDQPGAPGAPRQHLRLAQVLSMWEDTFTGAFKFQARWLVHSSTLPDDAFARLQAARRAFADEKESDSDSGGKGASAKKVDSPPSKEIDEDDGDEVFLTDNKSELDIRFIVKPVTLNVDITTELPTHLKGTLGPRLTHAFDASTGDFIPVERTDAVIKRMRARHAEAVARASRLADEAAATKSGKPVTQSSGWLLPKRRTAAAAGSSGRGDGGRGSSKMAATSVRDSDSEGEPSQSEREHEGANSDDMEWENEGHDDDDSASTDTDFQQIPNAPPRKSSRRKKPPVVYDDERPVAPPAQNASLASSKSEEPLRKRPLRLSMPPVEEEPPLSSDEIEEPVASYSTSNSSTVDNDARSIQTRKSSAAARERTPRSSARRSLLCPSAHAAEEPASPGAAASAKPRPSIAGKRKRGRPAKTAVAETEETDFPPQRTLVGDDYQVDIPDLLSMKDRKKETAPPSTGTGAKMVWRSIRDWDPQSRGMLSAYLNAAKTVVQQKQARPGVAVHVRLGGDTEGGEKEGSDGVGRNGVASSYAVWAVTAGRSNCGVVRVACSEMAQTEVPVSAIQRVQSEEEALAALVKARCTLDDFDPALKILAGDEASPESLQSWTLQQVRTLEQALEKELNMDRRLHGWSRDGVGMDRDDFIDLAYVSKQVPGKTPTEVLCFYYRYLAAAQPLTDVVYGAEAAEARSREAILPPRDTEPVAEANSTNNSRPAAAPKMVNGPRTVSPATHNGSVVTCDPPTNLKPANSAASVRGGQPNKGPSVEKGGANPAAYPLSPPMSGATPYSSRGSAAAPVHRAPPPANGYHGGGYERPRSARDHTVASRSMPPTGVEVLEVDDSDDVADGADATWRPTYAAAGSGASRARYSSAEVPARHPGGQTLPWGARRVHSQPMATAAPDSRRYLPRTTPTAAHPAPPTSATPASYGYRSGAAVPGREGHPQQHPLPPPPAPHPHSTPQYRREVDDRGIGDAGRERAHAAAAAAAADNSEYPLYEAASAEQDTFGFMAPCWRLLQRAKEFMDQDQLVYMRGLILKHVQKPMTRDQLLERAESCLQDQQKIYVAFVKLFDRIDHVYVDDPLVPLYQPAKRAPDTPPEALSYRGRVPAAAAVPVPAADHRGHRPPSSSSSSSYSRAPPHPHPHPPSMPHAYAVPPGASVGAVGGGGGGGGGRSVPVRVPSESYSRVDMSAATDARRHLPMPPQHTNGGWDNGAGSRGGAAAAAGGETGRSRRLPPAPYPSGPTTRPETMYRDGGQDRGYEAGRDARGAWPPTPTPQQQHQQQQQQQPGRWRAGDVASSSPPVAAVPAEVQAYRRSRASSGWGNGMPGPGGGWN